MSVGDYIARISPKLPTFYTRPYNTKMINLSEKKLTSLEGINLIPHLDIVQGLNLSHNNLSSNVFSVFSAEELQSVSHLKKLDLSFNQIKILPTFTGFSNLQFLDLSHNEITILFAKAFNGLNKLQELNLSFNSIKKLPDNAFYGLNSLQSLFLISNQIKTISPNAFIGLDELKVINLMNNPKKFIRNPEKFIQSHPPFTEKTQVLWTW